MNTENNISAILFSRGFKNIQPTDELLKTIGITARRFFKILDEKIEMTLSEANAFAIWLGVSVDELTKVKN